MQDAGIKVIFGEGFEGSPKITHIEMKSGPDIACISTGNFHEGNAKMYTDCMLMTAYPKIVKDVNQGVRIHWASLHSDTVQDQPNLFSPNEMKTSLWH